MINVGDRVKDRITGFSGIAVCRTEWLYGCVRIGVQPEKTKDGGEWLDDRYFDEPQLEVVERAAVRAYPFADPRDVVEPMPRSATGGPEREGSSFARPDAR